MTRYGGAGKTREYSVVLEPECLRYRVASSHSTRTWRIVELCALNAIPRIGRPSIELLSTAATSAPSAVLLPRPMRSSSAPSSAMDMNSKSPHGDETSPLQALAATWSQRGPHNELVLLQNATWPAAVKLHAALMSSQRSHASLLLAPTTDECVPMSHTLQSEDAVSS